MPYFEVKGIDQRTGVSRSVNVSAHSSDEAVLTAFDEGLVELKVSVLSDRDLLHRDLSCFLYADPTAPKKVHTIPVRANYPASVLIDHPILVLTGSFMLAMVLVRVGEAAITWLWNAAF